jgi:hypothetical protein
MLMRLGRLQRQGRRAFRASAASEVFTSELAGWCWARQTLMEKRAPSRWQRESMIRPPREASDFAFRAARVDGIRPRHPGLARTPEKRKNARRFGVHLENPPFKIYQNRSRGRRRLCRKHLGNLN